MNRAVVVDDLKNMAHHIRRDVLDMTAGAGANGGHIGGSFSSAEIFAVLYGAVMDISPATAENPERDRFILSKGHCAIGHYAALKEAGFISEDDLKTFEVSGTDFPTHEVRNEKDGIEISSGSLGYGLSVGIGCALDAKRKGRKHGVFVLLGDGESDEGTVWEAAMAGARFGLDNLIAIVDVNGQSLDGMTKDIMPVNDIAGAWKSFGWNVVETNGNSIEELLDAFQSSESGKPTVVIAHTTKGKGLPSIEGKTGWHHARLTEEQYQTLSAELEGTI